MINFSYFAGFQEIAIVFSEEYRDAVQQVYDDCRELYPAKAVYLAATKGIICPIKCDEYESYIVVGIACPAHAFGNAAFYTTTVKQEYVDAILSHSGPYVLDSIYSSEAIKETAERRGQGTARRAPENGTPAASEDQDAPLLVVTESQQILDYYCFNYENVAKLPDRLVLRDRARYLMKEHINGTKIRDKKLFGIVFTNPCFEDIVDRLYEKLNAAARAYKILLKDISYERLISIDHLDCIVLVDCPVFQCNISFHIPIISPFSVESGLGGVWSGDYNRNFADKPEATAELTISNVAADLMGQRGFKGVLYRGDGEDDMEIHRGRAGVAARYCNEEN